MPLPFVTRHIRAVLLASRRDDPSHKQKVVYSLTEPSIALVPLLAHMGGWGLHKLPVVKAGVEHGNVESIFELST